MLVWSSYVGIICIWFLNLGMYSVKKSVHFCELVAAGNEFDVGSVGMVLINNVQINVSELKTFAKG